MQATQPTYFSQYGSLKLTRDVQVYWSSSSTAMAVR